MTLRTILVGLFIWSLGATDNSYAGDTHAGASYGQDWRRLALSDNNVTRPQAQQRVSPALQDFFNYKGNGPVKVWVFFTDKDLTGKGGFSSAAVSVTLTERASRRRAKVGLTGPVFADLPVAEAYVATIESLGGHHRRSSRWLNAASFEIGANQIESVSQLPFVAEIRPVAGFRRNEPQPTIPERAIETPTTLSDPQALDYGETIAQLEQLNVPAVHALGYTGAGVTLAIIDTGTRKTHDAISRHFAEGRVLAEYDFVHNDGNVDFDTGDLPTERNHGTQVFSVAAGYDDGHQYGPAYRSNFILCKTEDIGSETTAEEDNWVAALEFADSIGTDVITTSLGYMIFDTACHCDYTYEDMDGQTAIISIAASMCDGLGIVVSKSAGNSGPLAGSITAPADAFDILSVGSVSGTDSIYFGSSRGPTYDGRIKPEVCARGVSTRTADPYLDIAYGNYSGTSFAAPLIGGAACLVIEAHPDWTPYQVREALKASGDHASNPDNNYGWGIIDLLAAIQMDPPCCRNQSGNIVTPEREDPNIADVAALVDYLYINGNPISCLAEADLNLSGGGNPTRDDISIGDISLLIDYLFISYDPLPECF